MLPHADSLPHPVTLLLTALLSLFVATGCPDDPDDTPDMATQAPADMADEDDGVEQDAGDELDMQGEPDLPADKTIPPGCNPLAFEHSCFFPYPSDVFLEESDKTPSGKIVALTEAAKITRPNGVTHDFMDHHAADGFSHHQPIAASFGQVIREDELTFHTDDPAKTLDASQSATLLINASTGELVAHWAEIDRLAEAPEERLLFLRALENLDFETRYVVAIKGVRSPEGDLITRPEGFAQLMENDLATYPEIAPLRARYDTDIFPLLTDLGVDLDEVQLAWDFTTQSEEMITGDLFAMRDDLMEKLTVTPPAVTLTSVEEDVSDDIALRLEGTITVPLYLEEDVLYPRLHRDAEGNVTANGAHEVPFTMQVPASAMPESADFEPARLMQYGHGFFGSREEINYSFMRGYSNEERYVTASVDWRGMSEAEFPEIITKLSGDLDETFLLVNGVHQGIMNFIALSHALQTTIAELPELERFDKRLYAPDDLYYYGISQGQILGAAFLAASPHVDRAVIAVGGAPFSFMMSRSSNFAAFVALLNIQLKDDRAIQQFMTLSQHSFDRVDPSTYSAYLLEGRRDGGPEDRPILMHLGYWDHSVPTLAGLIFARNAGFDILLPSPVMPYGLAGVEGPVLSGSAAVLFDFGVEDPAGFYAQLPTRDQLDAVEDLDVHESIRRLDVAKDQIDAFLMPGGSITHTCDGPCDPE